MALIVVTGRNSDKMRVKIEKLKVLLLVTDEIVTRIGCETGIIGRWIFANWDFLGVCDNGYCWVDEER